HVVAFPRAQRPITYSHTKSKPPGLLLCATSSVLPVRRESCQLRHLPLAKGGGARIMGETFIGRSRLNAVPKEQPPRKLSGKRTSERPNRTLERGPVARQGTPKG